MAQKLLNAAMLFKDHVYTETAALCEVEDVFAADIRYHAHCCKGYFNRYQAKIEEILKNLEMEDSVTAGDASFKARFLALGLDFNTSAHSLTSIRDRLNEDSAESVSNRAVKQLIIEIHIIFDNYREDSIKNGERERRGKSRELVVLDLISPNQNVPVVLENFWSSSISKSAFQAFYVEWLTTNYKDVKPLYLGISPQSWFVSAGHASLFPRLNCTHEEADDRMMFHVQDILSHRSGPTSITLSSGDTDVFVCLLYHFTVNWRDLGLQELWLVRNSGRSILPLHDICTALGDELTQCLPALHALTGCDTTSKVGTKLAALNTIRKPGNCSMILNFNSPQLTESSIEMAETFLVKCLKPSTDLETFDDLRLASFNSNATLKELLALQLTQRNIFAEPITNNSCGSKHHLEMPPLL